MGGVDSPAATLFALFDLMAKVDFTYKIVGAGALKSVVTCTDYMEMKDGKSAMLEAVTILTFNGAGKIVRIDDISDPAEFAKIAKFLPPPPKSVVEKPPEVDVRGLTTKYCDTMKLAPFDVKAKTAVEDMFAEGAIASMGGVDSPAATTFALFDLMAKFDYIYKIVGAGPRQSVVTCTDYIEMKDGKSAMFDAVTIFTFNDDGKIVRTDDISDPAEFAKIAKCLPLPG